jgi:hypothetical protein
MARETILALLQILVGKLSLPPPVIIFTMVCHKWPLLC